MLGKSVCMVIVAMAIPSYNVGSSDMTREVEYRCIGLEAYEIRGVYDVDAGGGRIRSRGDPFSIGFTVGPMIAPFIPALRRAGLRWMKVENVGSATLRYGFDVKQKQLQATIVGAP